MARAKKDPGRCKHSDEPTPENPTPRRCRARKTVDETGYCDRHRAQHSSPSGNDPRLSNRRYLSSVRHIKHGIYSQGYTTEEIALLEEQTEGDLLSSLDEEILHLRVQIRRTTNHLKQSEEDPNYNPMRVTLEEMDQKRVVFDGQGNVVEAAEVDMRRQRSPVNYHELYLKQLAHLRNLVATRHAMEQTHNALEDDPQEAARVITQAVGEMMAATGIDPGMGIYRGNGNAGELGANGNGKNGRNGHR